MELWIRSQDKTFLKKVNTIGIVEGSDFWFISENLTTDFGKYKTKERALEILDEIQRLIADLQYMSYAIPNDKFTGYRPNVYEMPKE